MHMLYTKGIENPYIPHLSQIYSHTSSAVTYEPNIPKSILSEISYH